jgi:hypothetical protein
MLACTPNQPGNPITLLVETNFRSQRRRFGMERADRCGHRYIIRKTGTGSQR